VTSPRVWSGAVLFALAVGVVWFAPPAAFLGAACALAVLGVGEYARLARASDLTVPEVPAAAAAVFTCASFSASLPGGIAAVPLDVVLMTAFVALGALAVAGWSGGRDGVGSAAATLVAPIYLGLPLGALISVRETHGSAEIFLLMLTVMASDTAQYYTGHAFGRRLLAPRVSPKKTVEGAVGGVVFGVIVFAVAGHWWLPEAPPAFRVALGLAVVALGIVGDLFKSVLKRGAGVKDSSTLIPGHGGILDRIDALLFAAPVYYVVLKYLQGPPA
jgi:phosphatidate cytidylyltransferase